MRFPNDKFFFVTFNLDEERELARATYDMLRNSQFLTSEKIDFLRRKYWYGRGCFGVAIDMPAWLAWLDCVIYYDSKSSTPLDIEILKVGLTRAYQGKYTDLRAQNMVGRIEKYKKLLIDTWHSVWVSHRIRLSAEMYKEWPYEEIRTGEELLNKQPYRIEQAIQAEERFIEAVKKLWATGTYENYEDCLDSVKDSNRTATQILLSFDREPWLERIDEIHERTKVPRDVLRSRVAEFEPSPDYLYLIDKILHQSEKKVFDETKYIKRVQSYLKPKEEDDGTGKALRKKYGDDYVDQVNL